jgi:hypothetical protein
MGQSAAKAMLEKRRVRERVSFMAGCSLNAMRVGSLPAMAQ